MKVALCLYGQPRDAHVTFQRIKQNVIDPNDCDVFFHAWYDPNNASIDKMTPGHERRFIHHGMDRFLVDSYAPKSHKLESQRRFSDMNFQASDKNIEACWSYSNAYDRDQFISHKAKAIHSMWYSVMMSIMEKETFSHATGNHYDAVILSRFDVSPTSVVSVRDYDLNSVIVRNHEYPREEVSDWFMLSNNENMNVIGGIFMSLMKLYKTIKSSDDIWTNEAFIRDQLKLHKIPVQRGNFDVTF
jgi:hypothetical protein